MCNVDKITYNGEEKHLMKSSICLLIPSIVGYMRGNTYISHLNIASCGISRMFWNYPIYNWRRYLDIYFQSTFSGYLFILGNYTYTSRRFMLIGNLLFTNGLYFFYCSNREYHKKNRFWYIYHSIFHFSMSAACSIVHLAIS